MPAWWADMDGPGQRHQQLGRRPSGLGRARQAIGEAPAFEQLQGDERQAFGLTDVENLQDVRVAEPSDRLGLDRKPHKKVRVRLAAAADHLQGDQSVETDLPGLVDDSHPSLAEPFLDFVTRNSGSFVSMLFVFAPDFSGEEFPL